MLYDPARHAPLKSIPWNAQQVQETILEIAEAAQAHFNPETFYPPHPQDDFEPGQPGFRSLYFGAAGVLAGLGLLVREAGIPLRLNLAEALETVYLQWKERTVDWELPHPGYMIGESGILLPLCLYNPKPEYLARLAVCVEENIPDPANEVFWAAPGTMHASRFMHHAALRDEQAKRAAAEATSPATEAELDAGAETASVSGWDPAGEAAPVELASEQWKKRWLDAAKVVLRRFRANESEGCDLWLQDLYGKRVHYLGPAHGFAGNVQSLLLGGEWLSPAQHEALYTRTIHTIKRQAVREQGLVNWPPTTYITGQTRKFLVQWCHGAPGMVMGLADIPAGLDAEFDQLMLDAGEMTWHAGPLAKGSNLCHGTGGNGCTFLSLFKRTGDECWLERAHLYAMHAIDQYQEALKTYGQGRFSLWTGDIGLAWYLHECLRQEDSACPLLGMPGLDIL